MEKRKRKMIRNFFLAVFLITAGLFLLNFQLTKRLEKYLKKELAERTAKATDGFYRLSFDDLSISFFKGELKVEGVRLNPDSTVFRNWMQKDSLPFTYVTARIGVIDFKGLNLTWRFSYKRLHFNSFEIRNPDIKVYNSYYSSRTKKEIRQAESKTLYEVISPYIDVLSVQTLNLENASVSFTVVNPFSPIVYALTNVSFHAYGFRLDENSTERGKLLYCDNFDFVTNQPQALLTNSDFTLGTDSIRLSTEDSIIYISNIDMQPQNELWEKKRQRPDNYIDALIKGVEVRGVSFRRERALNYLTARSFDILSPDISVFNLAHKTKSKSPDADSYTGSAEQDTLVNPLSLYEIISPVLHSVAVESIGISQAKLQYSMALKDTVERYKLANFEFRANGFLVDSVAEAEHGFWYSRNFAFEATGLEGRMSARNHRFQIKRMALNTETGDFNIEKFKLRPLTTRTRNDYLSGGIDTLRISGLSYDNGISADLFVIKNPDLRYVVAPGSGKKTTGTKVSADSRVDVESILNPFLRYLSVKRIDLDNADVILDDRSAAEPVTYRLNRFNFFATDLLMNEQTGRRSGWFFDYGNMGFDFALFDNYLPGKNYRLSVRNGRFSTYKGVLSLQDIELVPLDSFRKKTPDRYFNASVPALYVTGLKRLPENPAKNLRLSTLRMERPDIRMFKKNGDCFSFVLDEFGIDTIVWDTTQLRLGSVDLIKPVVDIWKRERKQEKDKDSVVVRQVTDMHFAKPDELYRLLGNISGRITLGHLNVSHATMDYAFHDKDNRLKKWNLDTTDFVLDGLLVDNLNRTYKLDDIRFSTRNLAFPLDNGFYTLKVGNVDLRNSNLRVGNIHLVSPYPKMEFAYLQPHHKDWFDVRVGGVTVSGIDLPGYFRDRIVRIKDIRVEDAVLQNFKNQKIPVPLRKSRMIYTGLQRAPLKLKIDRIGVKNFSVVYEELSKKGTRPGKLFINEMNGRFSGFTNIVTDPDQYIRLDANGKFMGKGVFNATWMLPVDSLNDRFMLNACMDGFDLMALNGLISPMASAEVQSGYLDKLTFETVASSKGATINMQFLYHDLRAALLKEKDSTWVDKKLLTSLINRVLKHNNPDKTKDGYNNPRIVDVSIIRDPYHSTFNYLWQILRPALVESVGVSKKKQEVARDVLTFFKKVKNFFRGKKKSGVVKSPDTKETEPVLLEFEPVNE